MGLMSRTATFVRYSVEGQLPENFWDFAAERIAGFSFQDIDDTVDEYSIGAVQVFYYEVAAVSVVINSGVSI